jgi:hypothetical protein
MLPFVASQAIVLNQVKKTGTASRPHNNPARSAGKGLFSRLIDAFVKSRMRRVEIELDRHRRVYGRESEK